MSIRCAMGNLLLLGLCGGCHSARMPELAPRGPHFQMLTYNINWGQPRPDLAAEIIRGARADIVCLQETTPQWEKYLRAELGREYPHMVFRNSAGRAGGGLGFLSKARPTEVAYVPSESGWFDGWIMQFQTAVGAVQMLNVHLRPPVSDRGSWISGYWTTRDDRQREIERFFARARPNLPLIVAGDFNEGEGGSALNWLRNRGMRNALAEFDRSTPTWEWQTSLVTLRRRMDHVMYSPELSCYDARVIKAGASDHFPVIAAFGMRTDATAGKRAKAGYGLAASQ